MSKICTTKLFRRILFLMFAMVILFGGTTQVHAAGKKSVKKAYQKILTSSALKGGKFAVKDINGDGIKELLTWDDYYACPHEFYTYYKGKVHRLYDGEYKNTICHNSFHVYYDSKNKWIVGDNSGTTEMYICYKIKKGKAVFKRRYAYDLGEYRFVLWTPKKMKPISEERFKAYGNSLTEIKPHANTKKNRAKYL